MTELRPWAEEGAEPTELELLAASRREHAPSEARSRALKALGITVALSAVTTTTAAAAGAIGRGVTLLKVLGVTLVGGSLVAGGVLVEQHVRHAPAARSGAVIAPDALKTAHAAPLVAPAEPVPTAGEAAPSASSPSPVLASAAPRAARAEPSDGRLSKEVKALELAHQALAAHDPSSALRLLDRYRREFPSGALGSDATVLRVQALLAAGDRATAQRLADAYSTAHPDTPYARRIQDILRSGR
ncbi:MAG TPA: hypothetical protein VNW92_30960 [Polyangiaceae bacterium]|jgi:hypothetical protein|nr:hypothetical protein [Polyangiaceae bacterium]